MASAKETNGQAAPDEMKIDLCETTANLLKSEASDLARELFGQLRGVVA
jgi:hypothetical protein